jgi:hypothetical protein
VGMIARILISFHCPTLMNRGHAYCDTIRQALLRMILPGFDQETRDFLYDVPELATREMNPRPGFSPRLQEDVGSVTSLEPLTARAGTAESFVFAFKAGEDAESWAGARDPSRASLWCIFTSSAFDVESEGSMFIAEWEGSGARCRSVSESGCCCHGEPPARITKTIFATITRSPHHLGIAGGTLGN